MTEVITKRKKGRPCLPPLVRESNKKISFRTRDLKRYEATRTTIKAMDILINCPDTSMKTFVLNALKEACNYGAKIIFLDELGYMEKKQKL